MKPLNKDKYDALYRQMARRMENGANQRNQLLKVITDTVIQDRLVGPHQMTFVPSEACTNLVGLTYRGSEDGVVKIHKHALSQLCNKVSFPLTYLRTLRNYYSALEHEWPADLLAHNLNTLYEKVPFKDKDGRPRFLHRIVNGELRGFLSRKYNRHMASEPLLAAHLAACEEMGAVPLEAVATAVKYSLKCVVPQIFMPVDNYPVAIGVEWSNSDFGAGRLQVALVVYMPNQGRSWILDNAISRVHIGSVLEDSDLEISDETAQKEVAAQRSAVRDAVVTYLKPETGNRVLAALADASEEGVSWANLRTQLNRFLSRGEVDSVKAMLDDRIEDLPPVKKTATGTQPTTLWIMAALGKLAERADDPDRMLELQRAAGSFLKVKLEE